MNQGLQLEEQIPVRLNNTVTALEEFYLQTFFGNLRIGKAKIKNIHKGLA